MKTITAAVKLAILILAAGLAWRAAGGLWPRPEPNQALIAALEAQRLTNQIARAQAWRQVGIIMIWAAGLGFCGFLALALASASAWLGRQARETKAAGGLYPIQVYRTPWLLRALGRPEQLITLNPNNQVAPLAAATVNADGEIHGSGSTAGAPWEMQERTTRDINLAQQIAAQSPGRLAGRQRPRLARPATDTARAEIAPQGPTGPATAWTIDRALAENRPGRLAMGQDTQTGDLLFWEPATTPHLRYHGATQAAGKTSGSAMIALGAILAGYSVLIIDRRRGKDWGSLAAWAQIIDARQPDLFVDTLAELRQLHAERDAQLGRLAAANLEALPAQERPRRLLVILEEYGNHRRRAQAIGRQQEADDILAELTSEAGAGGIHILLIDQTPQAWDQTIKANVSAVLTGPLPEHSGQAAGYYHAHNLEPYTYHHAGRLYRNFDAMPEAAAILRRHQAQRPPELIRVRDVHPAPGPGDPAPTPPPPEATNGTNGANDRKWAGFAQAWIAAGGNGISALARAMAAEDGAPPDPGHPQAWPMQWESYKSVASQEWHHPDHQAARLAGQHRRKRKTEIRRLQAQLQIPQAEARALWLERQARQN